MESLQDDLTYNYEILALVYKHRPLIAGKAEMIYDEPKDDKQSIDVLQVKKFALCPEMIDKLEQE